MRNRLSLTVRTKLSLFVSVLSNLVLFFALITTPSSSVSVDASFTRTNQLSAPTDVIVNAGDLGNLNVQWNEPLLLNEQIKNYRIEYRKTTDVNWTLSGTTGDSTVRSYSVTGLRPNTEYLVRVAATNMSDEVGTYGYQWALLYETTNPRRTNDNGTGAITYTSGYGIEPGDSYEQLSGLYFSRVRYRMESTFDSSDNYVDADFDRQIIYPATYQTYVTGLSGEDANRRVFDNLLNLQVPSYQTGSKFIVKGDIQDLSALASGVFDYNGNDLNGRLELWPWNYSTTAEPGMIGDGGTFDINDTPAPSSAPTNGHGSFQLHQIGNDTSTSQTLFAWNLHRANDTPTIGFGDPASTHSDWTYCSDSCTARSNFKLQIYINTTVTTKGFRIDAADPSTFSGIFELKNGLSLATQSGNTFFSFDGVDDYIDTNLQYDNTTSFTIAAWFRQDESATGNRAIFSDEMLGGTYWDHRLMLANKKVYTDARGSTTITGTYFSKNSLPIGWNYVVSTLSDGYLNLYINGEYVTRVSYSEVSTSNQEIWIGASAVNSPQDYEFDGDISIVEYYSRGLSAEEIRNNFLSEAGRHFQPYSEYASGIIRIDKDKVDDDLTNFPVTIVLNSGNFDFSLVQTSGADVFFTDTNNNLLPFEVDYFNHGSGVAVYHVLYSGIITSGVENQDILIRYGSVEDHFYDFSNGYKSTEVWSNGYEFVSHMGSELIDSTGNRLLLDSGTSVVIESGLGESRRFNSSESDVIEISGILDLGSEQSILASFIPTKTSHGMLNVYAVTGIADYAWSDAGVQINSINTRNYPMSSNEFDRLRTLTGTVTQGLYTLPDVHKSPLGYSGVSGAGRNPSVAEASILNFNQDTIDDVSVQWVGSNVFNPANKYAIEVSGWIVPKETGTYRFDVDGDDSVDLFINGQLVSHYYGAKGNTTLGTPVVAADNGAYGAKVIGTIDLVAGRAYPIRVRMQEYEGGDSLYLFWQRPSQYTNGSWDNNWYIYGEEIYHIDPRLDIVGSFNNAGYGLVINSLGYPTYFVREGSEWPSVSSPVLASETELNIVQATNNPTGQSRLISSGVLSSSGGFTIVSPNTNTIIGQDAFQFLSGSSKMLFNGTIDELRLSSVERSVGWAKAEYYALLGELANPVYSVVFNTNGGSSISSITGQAGSGISVTNPTKDGFRFTGWYEDISLTTAINPPTTIPLGGDEIYAKWTPSYDRYASGIIRIDKDKVDDDLTNFPVTIVLNSGNFNFNLFQTSGADVFFTDTNNNLLPFEVDYFNHGSGIAVYHVLYSGIITSGVENQDILIRYGSVDDYYFDFSEGYNPTDVWDDNYVLVMHMGEELKDSSRYNLSITNNGTTYQSSSIGQERVFDGNDDFLTLGTMASGVYDYSQGISVTYNAVWDSFNLFSRILDFGNTVEGNSNAANNNIIVGNFGTQSSGFFEIYGTEDNAGTSAFSQNTLALVQYQSSNVSYVLNGSLSRTVVNGIEIITTGTNVLPNTVTRTSNYIGESNWANDALFEGSMDELRISRVSRSSAWTKAEHAALSGQLANPIYTISFNTNGGDSLTPITGYAGSGLSVTPNKAGYVFDGWYEDAGLTTSGFTLTEVPSRNLTLYAKWTPSYDRYSSGIIRIDKDKVDDDLTNFPVTIVLNSGNFNFNLVQTSGADVFFTDTNNNLLPFEVDYFNHGSGVAVYHVLYSGIITSGVENQDILIRYGSVEDYFNDFSDGYNPTDVWDDNYLLVSHGNNTANSNGGSGVTLNGIQIVNSELGNAFSGSSGVLSDYIETSFKLEPGSGTVSIYYNTVGPTSAGTVIASQHKTNGSANGFTFGYSGNDSSNNFLFVQTKDSSGSAVSIYDSDINLTSDFNFLTFVYQTGNGFINKNGIRLASGTVKTWDTTDNSNLRFHSSIDDYWQQSESLYSEIRVSNISRSEEWLKAEYYALSGELAKPIYTVSFSPNGGSSVSDLEDFAGESITATSTKTGYTLVGWFEDDNTFNSGVSTIPARDISVYAKWEESDFVVSFENSGVFVSSGTVTYNSTYGTLPTVTRSGFTFNGWFTAPTGGSEITASTNVTVTNDHTLYARWSINTYTITFIENSGTSVSDISYDIEDSTITLPTNITRTFHRFDGWYDNDQFTGSAITTVDPNDVEDKTLYAKWTADPTTVIKVQASLIDQTLTNFPLTVILDEDNFDFVNTTVSGIYFMDSNGNLLDFEIDYIQSSPTNKAVYHVKVPTLSRTTDTVIWIRESSVTDYSNGRNPTAVWSNGYVFVSHMGSLVDSTGNVTSVTNYGTVPVSSIVGQARRFDGVNDQISYVQAGPLTQMSNSSITVIAFAKLSQTPVSTFRVIANTGGGWSRQGFYFGTDNTGIRNQMGTGSNEIIWYADNLKPVAGSYQLIGIAYNNSTNKQSSYLNTSSRTNTNTYTGIYDYRSNAPLNIGAGKSADTLNNSTTTSSRFFAGDIDEFRISNVTRTAAWVKTEYLSLNNQLIVFSGRPVITVIGELDSAVLVGSTYIDSGATAVDSDGADISNSIQVVSNVNSNVVGTYSVTYTVTNNGQSATATRQVRVIDITPPSISLSGLSSITIPYSASEYAINDPGLVITDNYDSGLSSYYFLDGSGEETALSGLVDVTTPGTYTVTYNVTDASGNTSTINRDFVVADTTPPIVSLSGASSITLTYGQNYSEPGQTYSDNLTSSANLVKTITYNLSGSGLTNAVHAGIPGTYTITYIAEDEAGNSASAVRTVTIQNGFEDFTFTNASVEGRLGPSLTQLKNTYNVATNPWVDNTEIFNSSNGIQIWTVPVTGKYRIRVAGASGRNINNNVGEGAVMEAEFTLTAGQKLYILVGQQSTTTNTLRDWQGGAGGTFVATGASIATSDPLIVAGGGGTNRSTATGGQSIMRASTGTSGKNGSGSNGGINGNAASGGGHNAGGGGSAAGFYTNGVKPTDTRGLTTAEINALTGGFAFVNGGNGAYFYSQYSDDQQGDGFLHGAFGGGGPAGWGGTGGGGGYSGGGNDRNSLYSGGGGSFVASGATEVKTSDGTFVITGNEPTDAYTGSVENLNIWNTGAGYVFIELAPAPVALNGLPTVEVAYGVPYVDPGISIGNGASNVSITSGITLNGNNNPSVNTAVLNAVYTITYDISYTEAGVSKTLQLTRTVTVRDLVKPTVTLNGSSTVTVNLGDTFTDPGVTASDDLDQNLTITQAVSVLESGLNAQDNIVDVNEIGVYRLTYYVTDDNNNQTAVFRDITVVDISAPVITPTGGNTIYVELGTSYTDSGFTYVDNGSGVFVLSSGITFNGTSVNAVNPNQLGTYLYQYNVTDPSGNLGSGLRSVIVRDTIAPVITRLGSGSIRIPYGSTYNDSGVTVSDASGSITPTVVNPVNTNAVGTYTITYDAVDPSGNNAIQVTRTVEVFDDVLPSITGIANANINADVTSGFVIPSATITDNTGQIASSGVQFFRTSGMVELSGLQEAREELLAMNQVTLRYTATDPSGNTRTVDIVRTPVDNINPVFSGLSTVNVTGAQIAGFTLPIPEIIDNDPRTISYSVRAILGAASASDLTLLRPNQITALNGLANCGSSCISSNNSPSNERFPNIFDQKSNTKYLNFSKENTGVEFQLDQARSIKQLIFRSANDASARDPLTFVLQGYDGSNWVQVATGNTNLPTNRYTNGSAVSISGAPNYQRYRLYFPTLRNSAGANSMQIADVLIYVDDTVVETNIVNIRTAIQNRIPVTLEYTVTDAANNTTVVTHPINLVNFVPRSNPDVEIELVEGTANQVFTFTYPANPMIDTDFDETLVYTTSGLPPGLSFDASTMTVSGTPTLVPGASIEDYTIQLIATDSQIDSGVRTHVIRIFYTADITFVSNGGSAVAQQSNIISQALPNEPIPVRTGYAFEGWYTNVGLTNAFDWSGVMPDTNQTLYAKWSLVNYPIQYVYNIGNTALKGSYTIEDETYVFPPAGSAGRTFMGWFYDSAFTQAATQVAAGSTGAVTVYAKWETLEYTLSFRADGRTVDSYTIPFGGAVPGGIPAIPDKKGHTAVGWDSVPPATMPARSVRINAIYEINQYTATYEDDEGNVLGSETLDYGSTLTLPAAPEKEGFTFKGWSSSASTMPDADVTIKAQYEAIEYTVTFSDGETTISTSQVKFGDPVTPPSAPEKEGFEFESWSGLPATMPASDVTVTAVYTEIEEEPEEETPEEPATETPTTPGSSGGSGGVITTRPVTPTTPTIPEVPEVIPPVELPADPDPVITRIRIEGEVIDVPVTPGQPLGNLPTPTLEGYDFKGWMNAVTGEMLNADSIIENPEFVVLTPIFEKTPNILDAARRVFTNIVTTPSQPVTNDNTSRTDNISATNEYGIDILDTVTTNNGLVIEVRVDGTAMIELENERTPITFNAQGFDIPSTILYYLIGDQPEDYQSENWKVYVGEPFFTDTPGASVFFMIKDGNDRNEVQYYRPATFISNAVNIPLNTETVRILDSNRNLITEPDVIMVQESSITQLDYDGQTLDFFTINANQENLDRIEIRYRTDEQDSFVLQLDAATWNTVFLQPGQIANILLRNGKQVDFITNYIYTDGTEVRESFLVSHEGEFINVILYNDPNMFLHVVLYTMITGYIGYVVYPYLPEKKENPLVS